MVDFSLKYGILKLCVNILNKTLKINFRYITPNDFEDYCNVNNIYNNLIS